MLPVRRLWLYFRWGNGSYIAFILSTWQFITIEYYLFLSKTGLPLTLWQFTIVFTIPYFAVGAVFGVIHKRFQSGTDIAVANLTSPFTWKTMPGKEKEVYLPAAILGMESGMATLEALGKLSPELRARFENTLRQLNELKEGKEFR